MSRSNQWKAVERNVAVLLGGQRVPVSGRARGDQPDVQHERYAVEVKHRKQLPAWLLDAMDQADQAARDGQLAMVVLHEKHQQYEHALVVLRLHDFKDLIDDVEGEEL